MQTDYSGLSVAVLGFGRSGRGAVDFLCKRGARVTVYDEKGVDESLAARYRAVGVAFCVGPFPRILREQLLVRSPVIRPDHPSIASSTAAGAILTSECELFLQHCRARTVGVTGSDGKTTTANLIARLLRGAGYTVHLGGNNGTPLLPAVDEMQKSDFAVLELSSFQLMTVTRSPEIAVITNITPNHLNWHTDMAEYEAAKRRILACGAKRGVINAALVDRCTDLSVPTVVFGSEEGGFFLSDGGNRQYHPRPDTFLLPGRHNMENLAAAYGAVRAFLPFEAVGAALEGFRGVPHRLQYVDTVAGVAYYNSSIDTSPVRTAAALAALGKRVIVLAGGQSKGIPLAPLRETFSAYARTAVLYGEAAREIEQAVGGVVPTHRFPDFFAAFHAAARLAEAGDTVVLSPACTAFDQFRDFEARGEAFCAMVKALREQD